MTDNCLGLAAELAYYFFLALFPALLFLVAILSFIPIDDLMTTITGALARVAPNEVLTLIQNQIIEVAHDRSVGLLTLGMIGTIWSTSSGITAIITRSTRRTTSRRPGPGGKCASRQSASRSRLPYSSSHRP